MIQVCQVHVRDFTTTPGARYRTDGPFSGQEFREDYLVPALKDALDKGAMLEVNLDHAVGFGTSFLEEAFGGLQRAFPDIDVVHHLRVICRDEPEVEDDVRRYLREERERQG